MKETLGAFLRNLPVPPEQVVGIAVGLVLERQWRARLPGSDAAHRITGWSIVASGGALNSWALSQRRRHTTGVFDLERPDGLVTTGPYTLSRHPMYVGWWLVHLGVGVLTGSVWFLVTVPAAVLIGHRGVLAEERAMADLFGPDFREYAEKSARYLPRRLDAAGRRPIRR